MHFHNPQLFWAFTFIPMILLLFGLLAWQRKKVLAHFGENALIAKLLPKEAFNLRPLKMALLIGAWSLLIVALTRPLGASKAEMVERKGVDIMVALDISRSMLAEDIIPNRIKRAKHEITKLIDIVAGDRIGLIVFAGESFVQSPLTLDYGAAKLFLDAVNTDWIGTQGTDVAGAIKLAQKSFPPANSSGKVLIIISDGETQQGDAKKAAQEAAQSGITIYTVGVGAEKGVPIPLKKHDDNVTYLKDKNGNAVMTRLDPQFLEEIAIIGGGSYFSAGVDLNLTEIYQKISTLEESSFGMQKTIRYYERYQLFLLFAFILFMIEFFLPDFIKKIETWRGRFV